MNATITETRGREAGALLFYFEPLCPFTWRTSQWIREVQRLAGLDVSWRIFSLGLVNDQGAAMLIPVRTLAFIGNREGARKVGKLYESMGKFIHEEGHEALERPAIERAVREGLKRNGMNPWLLEEAMEDPDTLETVTRETNEARERYGAYGSPWLVTGDADFGFNGPIMDAVPRGDEAVELWRHVSWLLQQPYFFELKRERGKVPAGSKS